MPSNVVKCAHCNIVINELLAFVNNKISVMDDESISRICLSAFSESDIVTAKNMLFDSMATSKRKINRKRQGKELRDIDDIICALRDTDSEEIPVFVARDLEKLPPVLFDHVDVTRLLKDIVKLQQDIKMITKDYATVKQVDALKCEVETLKHTSLVNDYGRNVNMRRGACLINSFECHSSGPMGLPPGGNFDATIQHSDVNCASSPKQTYRDIGQKLATEGTQRTRSLSPLLGNNAQHESAGVTHDASQLSENENADKCSVPQPPVATASMPTVNAAGNRSDDHVIHTAAPSGGQSALTTSRSMSQKPPPSPAANSPMPTRATMSHSENMSTKSKSAAEIAKEGNWKPQTKSDEWIRVERKKLRNRFVGNRGNWDKSKQILMDSTTKLVSFNCKNVVTSVDCVRRLCQAADVVALQETWLLPHDIGYLGNIDNAFAFTGTSAVDTSAGVLRGRSYGGVALLWRKSAFIFQALEGASEMDRLNLMDTERDSTAQTLWLTFLNANRVGNTTQEIKSSIDEVLHSYQRKVVDAVNHHGWDGSSSNLQWSFSSAFLYSLTVITTIGYGHLSPRTNWGKVVTVFYSLLGMPLFLLYLTNVGELLARWCKWLYALICLCRGCPGFSRRRIVRLRNQLEISDAESIERPEHWTIHPYLDSIDRSSYRNPDVRNQDFRNTYDDCSSRNPDYRNWNRYQGYRNHDRYPGKFPPRVPERVPLEVIPERHVERFPVKRYQESRHLQPNGQQRRPDYLRSASMPHPRYDHPRDPLRGWSEPAPRMEEDASSEFTYVTFDAQTITVPISVCVAIMVGYLMFGSMIFGLWEKWDQLDGAYFCFISLSSIGFGDFVPGERVYTPRIETSFIVCSMYLMLGMALVAMCFNLMQEQVIHYVAAMKRAAKRAVRCCRCQSR
ncbi:hypothetical protein O0L34_g15228 [Tuta absoluta]|nr:hypothetical protein O0L34_g15228 [Tuta absoluta]